ncbi:hypothetical protein psal_cds_1080 [Pandoravirus salinus]|uniref:F-box domain containing protein n=1 Tax=Pandoravirus salinus TaxID=1349410 RepID=A0A291ATZ1_9VIRU|nr:hypothetical protein psal_cds_1080 [Pandoravirus salinus]ATE82277.1 hypothetical protein psal_cds_1080 [Pandoravirus salinus]
MESLYYDVRTVGGFGGLPNELLADIIERIGASDPFDAAGLCNVDPQMRMWCRVPLFDATLLPPTIQRNLDAPAVDQHGPRKVSIAEAVRARTRRDAMRTCVLYALYSLYAFMGHAGEGPVGLPVLPFDSNKTDDDWAVRLFPAMYDGRSRTFGTVYVTLPDRSVRLDRGMARVNNEYVWDPPHDQHYAAINGVLTQALIRAVVHTGSEADTPAICASVDVQRAFFDDAGLPNGHYVTSGKAAVALNVARISHIWYPWADNVETFESALKGEPIHVYDTAPWRAKWLRTVPPTKEAEDRIGSIDWPLMDRYLMLDVG